ncbi:MAG: hypothetical protein DRP66_01185 [Planctomycetota bacterium]|nr:MAG: hypothetical protein DRP66_01185 [Planctomycetota bacterium]
MRSLCMLLLCCCGVVFSGCQEANRGIEVIVADGTQFPAEMAGKWVVEGKNNFWAMTFEADGTISWCALGMGGFEVVPGKVSRFPTRYGGKGIFKPGKWTVSYDPSLRELSVEVVIEHFHMDLKPGQSLEGSTTDFLSGPVSEDYTVWEADWFSKEKLVGFTPERKEVPETKELQFRKKVIFRKEQQTTER